MSSVLVAWSWDEAGRWDALGGGRGWREVGRLDSAGGSRIDSRSQAAPPVKLQQKGWVMGEGGGRDYGGRQAGRLKQWSCM